MSFKTVEKEEIVSLLTQDAYYRKIGAWPLLTSKDIIVKDSGITIKTDYFSVRNEWWNLVNIPFNKFQEEIDWYHHYCTELLNRFAGHIIACGGAITKNLIKDKRRHHYRPNDIDFFFYDLNIEQATRLRTKVIQFLIDKWQNKGEITVLRNEFVTTIYVTVQDNEEKKIHSYQLIHRIYPSISTIIGGFDLSICMVAYDGKEIYATPLGAWSIKNQAIIVDTSRRSTSFEYRICKYFDYGITIIFPGLIQEIVERYVINPCKKFQNYDEVFDRIKELAEVYGYDVRDINMVNNHKIDLLFIEQQKKENILPFLNINDGNNYLRRDKYVDFDYDSYVRVKIGILPYNQKDIEERYTNKISDYSHHNIDHNFISHHNATRLRLNNLAAVVSILYITEDYNIDEEAVNPDLKFTEREIEDYRRRTARARTHFEDEIDNEEHLDYLDNDRLTRCFGKLASEVKVIRHTEQYNDYVEEMIENMKNNAIICRNNLIGIKWITKNPGRQWTASINPIFADPREWYGKHYISVKTGIPEEIETTLRLLWKKDVNWSLFPEDIFNIILLNVMKNYADTAWKYI